jgi:predicted nucleic acid-binding Zn ribbon protein
LIVIKARGFPAVSGSTDQEETAMPRCLYCQQENPPNEAECSNCGMPLPAHADSAPERRQRRFLWFCIGLSIFCAVMIVWLPRYLF